MRFSEIDFGKIPRQTAEDVVLMMIDEGKDSVSMKRCLR